MTSSRGLWAIVAIAAALRLFPVWFGLPYPYARPDEAESISRAAGILAGDPNPHFFHWPSLTFYLFAAALGTVSSLRSLAGSVPPLPVDVAVIAARAVVALAGALTVVPLFRLGRRIAGERAGLLAAAFLAVAPLHVRDSHFAMTDVLMTLLLVMALAALVAAYDAYQPAAGGAGLRRFALAGLLAGLATSTKYNAAVVIVSMAAVQALLLSARGASFRLRSLAPLCVFGAAMLAGFVAGTPFAVLDFPAFAADFRYDLTHLSEGHAVSVGRGWYAHAAGSLPYGCGPVMLFAAVVGLVAGVFRAPRQTFIVGAFAVAYYAAIGSGYTAFFRYVMPLVPVVALWAAMGVDGVARFLAGRLPAPRLVAAILALAVALPSALTSLRMDLILARPDTRVVAGQWLGPQLRAGHTLHDAGSDYTRLDLRDRQYHEWHFQPTTQSFGHPDGLTPDWIVIGGSPLRHYASADPGLQRLAQDRYDAVFTIRGATGGVFDRQDAFFLPFSNLAGVERPGPTITIYKRRP